MTTTNQHLVIGAAAVGAAIVVLLTLDADELALQAFSGDDERLTTMRRMAGLKMLGAGVVTAWIVGSMVRTR